MKAPASSPKNEWLISVDPASNQCGIVLVKNGTVVDWICLESNSPRDPFSVRLQTISLQLDMFLRGHIPEDEKVRTVICEGVRSTLVQVCIGALLVCPQIEARITSDSFIHSTSWKKWAQKQGATGPMKDIKGVKAMHECGLDYPITSDDVADSLLIYMTWKSKQ